MHSYVGDIENDATDPHSRGHLVNIACFAPNECGTVGTARSRHIFKKITKNIPSARRRKLRKNQEKITILLMSHFDSRVREPKKYSAKEGAGMDNFCFGDFFPAPLFGALSRPKKLH